MVEPSMKDGICPKCGSEDVYMAKAQQAIPVALLSLTFPMTYVCANCGYIESYISDEEALAKIAEKWPRADGRKKKNDEL